MKECLSRNIKTLRQYKNLNQSELAQLVDVSAGYIGFIETGIRSPSLDMIRKIAEALEVQPYRLFQNERDMFSSATPEDWCTIRALLEDITVRTEMLHAVLDTLQKPPGKD